MVDFEEGESHRANPQDQVEQQQLSEEEVVSTSTSDCVNQDGSLLSTHDPSISNDENYTLGGNHMTAPLLQGDQGGHNLRGVQGNDGAPTTVADVLAMTPTQFLEAASQPHSGLRLVLRKIGNFLATFTLLTMLVVIPIVTYSQLKRGNVDSAAFNSAGVMVVGTLVLSVRLVYLHFTHWYMPSVQKYIIRILWMVPLYAVQSWLSLRIQPARIYIDTIRDLYEAFVISSFFYYLIELLGGQDALVRTLRAKVSESPDSTGKYIHHNFPLNYVLEPWELGMEFMMQTKHGVLQYVVIKTVAALFTLFFESINVYGEGEFRWSVAYPYITFMVNSSVMYALYCLVLLFHVISDDLRYPINWRPLGKFLCVKGVVFFTWWQGVIIFYLESRGIIDEKVAYGLVDYCICIEMVFFAIAHSYTFTYTEYLPSTVRDAVQAAENEATVENDAPPGQSYRPPITLDRPMNVRDAFWSSTVPTETVRDIKRLRRGVDWVVNQATDSVPTAQQERSEEYKM